METLQQSQFQRVHLLKWLKIAKQILRLKVQSPEYVTPVFINDWVYIHYCGCVWHSRIAKSTIDITFAREPVQILKKQFLCYLNGLQKCHIWEYNSWMKNMNFSSELFYLLSKCGGFAFFYVCLFVSFWAGTLNNKSIVKWTGKQAAATSLNLAVFRSTADMRLVWE